MLWFLYACYKSSFLHIRITKDKASIKNIILNVVCYKFWFIILALKSELNSALLLVWDYNLNKQYILYASLIQMPTQVEGFNGILLLVVRWCILSGRWWRILPTNWKIKFKSYILIFFYLFVLISYAYCLFVCHFLLYVQLGKGTQNRSGERLYWSRGAVRGGLVTVVLKLVLMRVLVLLWVPVRFWS